VTSLFLVFCAEYAIYKSKNGTSHSDYRESGYGSPQSIRVGKLPDGQDGNYYTENDTKADNIKCYCPDQPGIEKTFAEIHKPNLFVIIKI